jgi:hypothetical protein
MADDEPTPEPEHKPPEKPSEKKGPKGLEGKLGGIPKKYLIVAAIAGIGIGLYLRQRNKNKTTATVTPLPAPASTATDTGTGSSPGGGGFISYPNFITGNDLSPQPTPAPIVSPQAPQTFGGPTPAASASVAPTAADHGMVTTQVTGPVVPLGSSPQSAVAAGITPAYVPAGASVAPVAPSPTQQPNYSGQLYTTPVTPDQQVSYPFIYG